MASQHRSKRVLSVVVSTLVLSAIIGFYFQSRIGKSKSGDEASGNLTGGNLPEAIEKSLAPDDQGLSRTVVVIQTARGRIRYKFYTADAPKTVHRIASLIHSGFYNGLIFHRVVPGFVIQGGDPTGTGMGGSGTNLPAEFDARKHVPGAVAMARAQSPDSADSQFYISLGTHPQLDGNYTVFGQVIEGQEVAAQIQVGDRMTSLSLEAN